MGEAGFGSVESARHHRALRRKVEAYLDGEADPRLAIAVRQHLSACWACSGDAEWLVLIEAALGRIGEHRPRDIAVARLARYAATLPKRQ
jgi:anti-sigma factor RsiW